MAGVVHIRLLGGFAVEIDGTTVTAASFERRSGAELVQYLALAPAHRAHREQVLDALWPDADPRSAGNQLNKAATFARNALGTSDAITVRDETLTLLPEHDVVIDLDVLLTSDLDDPGTRADALAAANGPLLPDSPYAEWTSTARTRAHLRHLDVLRAAGQWTDVIALEPADESAHLALMHDALERRDRTATLRQYDELERALVDSLGVEPSATARALRDQASAADDAVPGRATRATRTFVMTDLEGSTRAWEADPAQMSATLAHHDELVTTALSRGSGTVFKHTGDGHCAVYTSVADAVAAAVAAQAAVQQADWTVEPRPAIRIGIDTGEAEHRDDDWFGPPLNRTARIMSAGSGDQILCSAVVAEMARLDPATTTTIRDLGRYRLTDLAPLHLHRIESDRLVEATAPPRQSRLDGRPLPSARSKTFGRDDETASLVAGLDEHRLVTVVGPGGAGKTHLAVAVAADVEDRFEGGVWLCELGNVGEAEGAAQEVLAAIGGLRHTGTSVLDSIATTLGDRSTLLVVDNCEHVIDAVRDLAAVILDRCPGTRILATSRRPIELAAESARRLEPLARDAAITLFCTEAGRHGREISPTDPAVGRICEQLDDLPMAVRLAAGRARALDLETLESILADRFEHLRTLEPGGLEHHQTLRTTIGWSINALDRDAREFLLDLSVLANRFGLDAAAAVTARPGRTRAGFLSTIDELVRRSLLMGPTMTADGPEYRLLESVRLYAREEAEGDDARLRHLAHFVTAAGDWNREVGAPDNRGLVQFTRHWDDIRLAWATALELDRDDDVISLLLSTIVFANITMRFELLDWFERSLPADPAGIDSSRLARAYAGWSVLATYHGDFARAESLAAAVADFDDHLADGCWANAWIPWTHGELDDARLWLDRILDNPDPEAISITFGAMHLRSIIDFAGGADISETAHLLDVLSTAAGASARSMALASRALNAVWTDGDAALADTAECIEIADREGIVNTSMTGRSARALVLAVAGDPVDALGAVHHGIGYARERGLWSWVLAGMGTAALVFEMLDRPDLAATVLGARAGADYRSGFTAGLAVLQEERLREAHPDTFGTWFNAGRMLDTADAAALVLRSAEEILGSG